MNRPSLPTPNQPPSGLPSAAPAMPPAAGSVIRALPGAGPVGLPDGPPGELAAMLPPGNIVILGGPGSGKTALLEATMRHLLAQPGGTARLLTSSRQAAVASTERLLAGLTRASGGELGCVTWYAFARGLVISHADLLDYRGEPRPLSGPEQWALVRSLLALDQTEVDWGTLAPLADTRAFTDELAEFVLACERRLIGPEELLERARAEGRPNWVPVAAFLSLYGEHLALQDSVDQASRMKIASAPTKDARILRSDLPNDCSSRRSTLATRMQSSTKTAETKPPTMGSDARSASPGAPVGSAEECASRPSSASAAP